MDEYVCIAEYRLKPQHPHETATLKTMQNAPSKATARWSPQLLIAVIAICSLGVFFSLTGVRQGLQLPDTIGLAYSQFNQPVLGLPRSIFLAIPFLGAVAATALLLTTGRRPSGTRDGWLVVPGYLILIGIWKTALDQALFQQGWPSSGGIVSSTLIAGIFLLAGIQQLSYQSIFGIRTVQTMKSAQTWKNVHDRFFKRGSLLLGTLLVLHFLLHKIGFAYAGVVVVGAAWFGLLLTAWNAAQSTGISENRSVLENQPTGGTQGDILDNQ